MHDALADYVQPILDYGMTLLERLEAGAVVNLNQEQTALKKLLRADSQAKDGALFGRPSQRVQTISSVQEELLRTTIRYALTCWLDELITEHSPFSNIWAQCNLESTFFGTQDGRWKFWKEANQPLQAAEALEVFYLCVMLGFQGELKENPDKLRKWLADTQERLSAQQASVWQPPPALDPPSAVPPLRGLAKMKRMAMVCGLSLLVIIPCIAYISIRHN